MGWSSEKPEAWPTDGPDCEADHLASYGVINTMDLVEFTNLSLMLGTLLTFNLKYSFQFGGAYSPVMRPIAILGPSGAAPILSDPAVLACGVIKEEDVILDQKCDRKYNQTNNHLLQVQSEEDEGDFEVHERETYGKGGKGKDGIFSKVSNLFGNEEG